MSPYTTMIITREDAQEELFHRRIPIPQTDDGLEEKLFELFGQQCLYNFSIVSDYPTDAEDYDPPRWFKGRFDWVTTPEEMQSKFFSECPCCGYPRCGHEH